MSDLLIEHVGDGTYDLVIQDNDFVLVGDTEDTWPAYVGQNVLYMMAVWLGESAYDRSDGFPWEQGVMGRQPIEGIVALLNDRILQADGVKGLSVPPFIEIDKTTRRASISVQVDGSEFQAPVTLVLFKAVS